MCICGKRCGRAAVVEDLKTESSTRGLELPEVVRPALRRQALRVDRTRQLRINKGKEWLDHDLVTPSARGGPMQPQRARDWLVTLAARSGLPDHCRFHDLCHMWVSLLRAAGVSDEDVAKAAGHASPQVTMSMYPHAMAGSAHRVGHCESAGPRPPGRYCGRYSAPVHSPGASSVLRGLPHERIRGLPAGS